MVKEMLREETKAEEKDLVTSHPPLLPREPYTWLMMITEEEEENDSERHIFYSIRDDKFYVRIVPELQNKHVACCYGGLLVLVDNSTDDCSILNILTMEKLQLPPLIIPPDHNIFFEDWKLSTDCVMSSPVMDRSCRVIFIDRDSSKFWSCHLGDSEFIERELKYKPRIQSDIVNFKGKLYALTAFDLNLITFDFTDPDLHHEQVISGESLPRFIFFDLQAKFFVVGSCEDLLLIYMGGTGYDDEVCGVKIFKADFSIREWVKLDTLGDRAILVGPRNNTFSSRATDDGLKGNAIYWVRTSSSWCSPERHLYMYDLKDKSISMSLPFPIAEKYSSLSWVSISCNEETKLEQIDRSYLFEASPTEINFHVQSGKVTIKSTKLLIEQRKTQKREETVAIARKESLWADLPNDLLQEIFPLLFAGDSITFRSVCRSWYSVSTPLTRTTQQFVLPLQSSDCPVPLLMRPDNKAYNPIHHELYSMNLPDIPGARIRAAKDGWLLMDYNSSKLLFYNPFTKEDILLPDCGALYYCSVYFSGPPTSADCLVVVAAKLFDFTPAICFKKREDEGWTCHEISQEKEPFAFSFCNAVVYEGLFYFLGTAYCPVDVKIISFNPKTDEVCVFEAPKFISELMAEDEHVYMLESEGKLITIFVSTYGSSVHICEWNIFTSKWELLGSLGNKMLFISHSLSICKKATVSGTGNKIYFPRVVGDGHILFYSLATKMYHTFETGTSYSNFFASKFYPEYNGWFML